MNNKPSILMLAQLPPPVHGASVMNKAIADSAAVNSAFALETISIATAEAISDIGKTSAKKYLKFLALWFRVIRALARRRHDLVYLTLSPFGAAFIKDALLALTVKAFGRPLVYHLHGKGIAAELARGGWRATLYRRVFRQVDVIQLAPSLYADIAALVNQEQVHFLGNGVGSQALTVETPESTPALVYLSNMVPTKGARVLLEAARLLAERGLNFRVRYAGNWGTDPQFQQDFLAYIAAHGLDQRVHYLGPQYGEDKKRLLNSGAVFVLPTYFRNECFPLAVLEAMSCGLPVVSTFEGAIPDMVEDGATGLLVKQQDVVALADALEQLIRDPALRRRMGEAGRARYQAQYTLQAFENNFIGILRGILERAA